jgi:hypothetical protein
MKWPRPGQVPAMGETPFDLAQKRKWQPIHQRRKLVAQYKSIRQSILDAIKRDKKHESI